MQISKLDVWTPLRALSIEAVGAACMALFLAAVWLRFHSWEAYMYAASAEGFFRMSEMFSAVHGQETIPEISRYHPYHPFFHMLVEGLQRAASWLADQPVSALTTAVVVNKLSAFAAAVLAFRILHGLLQDRLSAVFAVGALFCTKAFLFGAFSGDAHILSLALFLGAFELVLRPDHAPQGEGRRAALAALLFSLGAAMNLAIFFYGIAPLAVLLQARRFHAAVVAVALSGVMLSFVYVALPVALFDLADMDAYQGLFGLYSYMPQADDTLAVLLRRFVDALSVGLVGGIDGASAAARIVLGFLLLCGAVCLWRAPASAAPRFWVFLWIVGFAVGELAMHTVTSVNGTVYVMLPLFALVGALLRALARQRVWRGIVVAVLLGVAGLNVAKVVMSKALAGEPAEPLLAAMDNAPTASTPVAVLLTHMSLFHEIYHLGHDRHFTNMTAFIPHIPQSQAQLQAWMKQQRSFCLLSAAPLPQAGLRSLVRSSREVSPDLYHFSVNHPESKGMIAKRAYFSCRIPSENGSADRVP